MSGFIKIQVDQAVLLCIVGEEKDKFSIKGDCDSFSRCFSLTV